MVATSSFSSSRGRSGKHPVVGQACNQQWHRGRLLAGLGVGARFRHGRSAELGSLYENLFVAGNPLQAGDGELPVPTGGDGAGLAERHCPPAVTRHVEGIILAGAY